MRLAESIRENLTREVPAVSLAFFRVMFGLMLLAGTIRFAAKGWIHQMYVAPTFHFPFYGFEWVKPLPEFGMYAAFAIMAIAALCIVLGYRYRLAAVTFFVIFTYIELIDKTNYLNHYYFVSLMTFLMSWLPMQAQYSIDAIRKPWLSRASVPNWMIWAIKLQIAFVYFFGGVAKLKADWLLDAQPLRIWLSANSGIPVIGPVLDQAWAAHLFSWGAMLFDLTIVFVLCSKLLRPYGYALLLVFHFLTAQFFAIGMFPYIMSIATLVFFSADFHNRVLGSVASLFASLRSHIRVGQRSTRSWDLTPAFKYVLPAFMAMQLALPFRHAFYPDNVLWAEEGFRFSWNIMLIEKTGMIEFTVTDPKTGYIAYELPSDYLTRQQEKQMSTQPDMILQFAHYLEERARAMGHQDVEVRAESYVALNGRGSRPLIDPEVDLTLYQESFAHKEFILPFAPQTVRTAGL